MTLSLKRTAIAVSTVVCATLFSFSWSVERGVSLSVESADARVGRPLTPLSVAGVARRQYRRGAYGYGGLVGAGVVAGAIGAAVAATSPYGYGGGAYVGPGYYGGGYGSYTSDQYPGGYNADVVHRW